MSDAKVTRDEWCGESLAGHEQGLCHCKDIIALRAQRDALAEALALILGKNDSWRINMTDSQQQSVRKALAAAHEIKEHDVVRLLSAIPSEGLEPGTRGTVVHVYKDERAFEVEFVTSQGTKVVTATAAQLMQCVIVFLVVTIAFFIEAVAAKMISVLYDE